MSGVPLPPLGCDVIYGRPQWLGPMPAMWLFVGPALTISFGLAS